MTELERALRHIKTRADSWAVKEVEKALSQEPCTVSVSEKEPNEITEEVTLRFFKNSLKVRWHDFVIYNVEWLKKNWQMEMDIVCGVEPCNDAVSREAVKEIINDIRDCISVEGYCAIIERLKKLPSVNPQPICEEREKGECPWYAG